MTFKDSLFGIHAPKVDVDELKSIEKYLSNEINVALIWLNSGKVITMREGVPLMKDILALPYPEMIFTDIEKILLDDISQYYSAFRSEGEKSEILYTVTTQDLDLFGEVYCRVLNSIYNDFKPLPPVIGNEFIAFPFLLGNKAEIEIPNSLEKLEDDIRQLIDNKVGYNLWIRRIIKVYCKNVIFLYKPNQKRYWLRSIAVRDADETFMDLFKQGK